MPLRLNRDRPRRLVDVSDVNVDHFLERTRKPVRPLNRGHPAAECDLVQPEIVHLHCLQPIEIHMKERQASAPILLNESERGAGDFRRIDTQTLGHSTDECRFACAQIPGEQHDRPGRERPREIATCGDGLGF